jgi:hypothetical protein
MQSSNKSRVEKARSNQGCFDCLPSRGPTWASVNNGVFLCYTCARAHQEMGPFVSDVRSVIKDSWSEADVAAMEAGGGAAKRVVDSNDFTTYSIGCVPVGRGACVGVSQQ